MEGPLCTAPSGMILIEVLARGPLRLPRRAPAATGATARCLSSRLPPCRDRPGPRLGHGGQFHAGAPHVRGLLPIRGRATNRRARARVPVPVPLNTRGEVCEGPSPTVPSGRRARSGRRHSIRGYFRSSWKATHARKCCDPTNSRSEDVVRHEELVQVIVGTRCGLAPARLAERGLRTSSSRGALAGAARVRRGP